MFISADTFSSVIGAVSRIFLVLSLICILPAAFTVLLDLGLWVVELLRGGRSRRLEHEKEESSRLLASEKAKDEEGFRETEAATKEDIEDGDEDDRVLRGRNRLEKDW